MRALCGAIITAGALIGVGLSALAFGSRYHAVAFTRSEPIYLHEVDRPLLYAFILLICAALIGLGIAFFGLAYHHKRRLDEHSLEHERHLARRTQV